MQKSFRIENAKRGIRDDYEDVILGKIIVWGWFIFLELAEVMENENWTTKSEKEPRIDFDDQIGRKFNSLSVAIILGKCWGHLELKKLNK